MQSVQVTSMPIDHTLHSFHLQVDITSTFALIVPSLLRKTFEVGVEVDWLVIDLPSKQTRASAVVPFRGIPSMLESSAVRCTQYGEEIEARCCTSATAPSHSTFYTIPHWVLSFEQTDRDSVDSPPPAWDFGRTASHPSKHVGL